MLTDYPGILTIYLLGSALNGTMRSDSDIGFALLMQSGKHINALEKADIALKLTILFERDVDLGEIGSRNIVYSREAILNVRRIYAQNKKYRRTNGS